MSFLDCDDDDPELIEAPSTCDVSGQGCAIPAGLKLYPHERMPKPAQCFRCGLDCCRVCSSLRSYLKYGVQRLCDNCQEEEDGTPYLVVRRHARRVGCTSAEASAAARAYDTPAVARRKRELARAEWLAQRASREASVAQGAATRARNLKERLLKKHGRKRTA